MRLVSLRRCHLAVLHYQVSSLDEDAELIIASQLINRQPLPQASTDPRLGQGFVGRATRRAPGRGPASRAELYHP